MAVPRDEVEIERVIAVAIYRHPQGDIEQLARLPTCARPVSRSAGMISPHRSFNVNPNFLDRL